MNETATAEEIRAYFNELMEADIESDAIKLTAQHFEIHEGTVMQALLGIT